MLHDGKPYVWLVLPDQRRVCVARHALADWLTYYPTARYVSGHRTYPLD